MRISRSKIEIYLDCPRCFYFDVLLRKGRPPGFPFTLNNAVDKLLKKEFDTFRTTNERHPLQENLSPRFKPAIHPNLEQWRNPFSGGIAFLHPQQQITYYGAIDDLWISDDGEYAVVDYKATAKDNPVTELPEWAISYQRQLSFYSYLLKQNQLPVYPRGFLLYATALTNRTDFNQELKFVSNIIEIDIDESWIEPVLHSLHELVESPIPPPSSNGCIYCQFVEMRGQSINMI